MADAIRSALNQTHPEVEVIVVDDGSTDGSLEVIRSFGDRVRCLSLSHRGGGAARNAGLEVSRGDLIQFLDADDLIHPLKLELQVEDLRVSGADLDICHGTRVDFTTGKLLRSFTQPFAKDDDFLVFVLKDILPTAAPLHRKQWLTRIGGFREDLSASQEFDLHLRLASVGVSAMCVPEVLYTVRIRTASVSSDYVKAVGLQVILVPPIYQRLREDEQLSESRARAFSELMARNARGCLQRGARDVAKNFFDEARRMHPDGGISGAYSRPTQLLYHLLGPFLTEQIVSVKRRMATFLPEASATQIDHRLE